MLRINLFVLFSFLAPIIIFGIFWRLKKPFWSLAVYVPLLLYSIISSVFLIGPYKGFWAEIKSFWYSDAAMWIPLCWLPSIAGYCFIIIVYLLVKRRKNKNP